MTTLQKSYQKALDDYVAGIYGHKKNLLPFLLHAIQKKPELIADLCCGTAAVDRPSKTRCIKKTT